MNNYVRISRTGKFKQIYCQDIRQCDTVYIAETINDAEFFIGTLQTGYNVVLECNNVVFQYIAENYGIYYK